MYHYKAHVTRIIDGDTIDALVDLGFHVMIKLRFRLNHIDAPEIYRPKSEGEKVHGQEATAYLKELIEGKQVLLRASKTVGIYGRWGADVCLMDGQDVVNLMKKSGFEKRSSYE